MPPKKRKASDPNDVDPQFDIILEHLYHRGIFRTESTTSMFKLAAISSQALQQIISPEGKDSASFLHSFRGLVRLLAGDSIVLPQPPKLEALDFSDEEVIDIYTLRYAAFIGLVDVPVISPSAFKAVADILTDTPVTKAYLADEHIPIRPNWTSTPRLPIVPSIVIIADACMVAYNRTAVSLHAYTPRGGAAARPVGGLQKPSGKKAGRRPKTAVQGAGDKGKGKAESGEDDADDTEEPTMSAEEDEVVMHIGPKAKRSTRSRHSAPTVSTASIEPTPVQRSARSRRSAPTDSTTSIFDQQNYLQEQ